jgi:predicted O-methyltransferase YrrM
MLRLEAEASREQIPIIPPEVGQCLEFFVALHKPQKVLEIGAAIGYSTLWLAKSFTGERIDTIELSGDNIKRLQQNIAAEKRVNILAGDALQILPGLKDTYDLVFVDAQKAQYSKYLELVLPHLAIGGLIVFDNVLWHGQVAGIKQVLSRFQRTAEDLRQFNKDFLSHPELTATVLPIGDGLAVGVKNV